MSPRFGPAGLGCVLTFFTNPRNFFDLGDLNLIRDNFTNVPDLEAELQALADDRDRTWTIIGGVVKGSPTTARALRVYFRNGDMFWQSNVLGQLTLPAGYTLTSEYDASFDDELAAGLEGDFVLNGVAYVLMIVWVAVTIGGVHKVHGMVLVGLAAVLCVLVSTIAGFGLASAFGVPFNTVAAVLPFLLLGIGVDDSMVLIASFRDTNPAAELHIRVGETLAMVGPSITMTTLTDVAAFASGTLSNLPAVQAFCTFAAITVAVDYVLQLTLFMALVAYDRMRASKSKAWYACCCEVADDGKEPSSRSWLERMLEEKVAPFVLKPVIKAVILLVFAGLLGMFGYFATQVEVGQLTKGACLSLSHRSCSFCVLTAHACRCDPDWIVPCGLCGHHRDLLSTPVRPALFRCLWLVGLQHDRNARRHPGCAEQAGGRQAGQHGLGWTGHCVLAARVCGRIPAGQCGRRLTMR